MRRHVSNQDRDKLDSLREIPENDNTPTGALRRLQGVAKPLMPTPLKEAAKKDIPKPDKTREAVLKMLEESEARIRRDMADWDVKLNDVSACPAYIADARQNNTPINGHDGPKHSRYTCIALNINVQ